jgi:hypothetical protein
MTYLLHVTYLSGERWTGTFPSAFARALVMVTLSAQPVDLVPEDRS